MGKSGCSLPGFSKRLREATFFVAFRSRGISIARPLGAEIVKRVEVDQPLRNVSLVFDLETIFTAASDALIGKVRVISYHSHIRGWAASSS